MNLRKLDNQKLLAQSKEAVAKEREATTAVLHHLREVERRRLYAERGYSGLWEFTTKYLGYSEGAAHRRIAAMRLMTEFPEIEGKLDSGALSLTVAAKAQTLFRSENVDKREFLEFAEGRSSKEVEREILKRFPKAITEERLRPLTDEHTEARIVLDKELKNLLDDLRSLLSHHDPAMPYTEVIRHAARIAKERLTPQRRKAASPPAESMSRAATVTMKAEVYGRDGGRCTYIDPLTGKRCESRHLLEYDHILPYSMGGKTSVDNLRLVCRTHNQLNYRKMPVRNENLQIRSKLRSRDL